MQTNCVGREADARDARIILQRPGNRLGANITETIRTQVKARYTGVIFESGTKVMYVSTMDTVLR